MAAIHQVTAALKPIVASGASTGRVSVAKGLTGRHVRLNLTFISAAATTETLARRPAMSVARGLTGRHVYPLANLA